MSNHREYENRSREEELDSNRVVAKINETMIFSLLVTDSEKIIVRFDIIFYQWNMMMLCKRDNATFNRNLLSLLSLCDEMCFSLLYDDE